MTYPNFNVGETLRAADMNAVGLWLVKSQTIGTGVSSVTVTGAFSADYDNYRIVISGGTANTPANMALTLGASATQYYGSLQYATYASGAYLSATDNNNIQWSFVGYCNTNTLGASFDLINPFNTKHTQILNAGWSPFNAGGTFQGIHQVATSYSSFTISSSATMTGGTIRVYGYRN